MSTLTDRIQAQAAALAERPSAEMYQNPFWQERFGAPGRELAAQHVQRHTAHLVQALAADDASAFLDYARRLQTELTSSGMCSRYIDESFERLDRALAELVPESGPARELLRGARQALVYERGPERELQRLTDAIAERTLDALWSRQTNWFAAASSYVSLASLESITQAERARWKGDVLEHLSFLADALHTGRAQSFCAYVVWIRDFFARRHAPAERMAETLRVLAECFPRVRAASGSERAAERQATTVSSSSAPRLPLSEPPAPPIPVPMSAELAENGRALIRAALERLDAEPAEPAAHRPRASIE
jgi:hypothetical protein